MRDGLGEPPSRRRERSLFIHLLLGGDDREASAWTLIRNVAVMTTLWLLALIGISVATEARAVAAVVPASVSAGGIHTCGVRTDGVVLCWGDNGQGQSTPPSGTFTAVSAGGIHTCGIRTNGMVACWGANGAGQSTPPAGTFTVLTAGDAHSCGIRTDGTVACWGDNSSGQATPPVGTFTALSGGQSHTCGVKTDTTL